MINKKGLIICLSCSCILALGITLIPKMITNNKETVLETNSILNESNSATFIADSEDETANIKELANKYINKNDIKYNNETETSEKNLIKKENKDIKKFEEPVLSSNIEETTIAETENIILAENETKETEIDFSVNNIQDNFTSSTSPNTIDIVTETAPQETQAEIIQTDFYNNTKEDRDLIRAEGIKLLELAQRGGINTHEIDNSIKIMKTEAYFAPQGVEHYINVSKQDDYFNVLVNVNINPEKSSLNNIALKELCKLISYNNDNVYNVIQNDFINEIYVLDIWNDTEYGFKVKVSLNEYSKPIYSIKY